MNKKNLKITIVSLILVMASVSFLRTTLTVMESNKRFSQLKQEVSDLENEKTHIMEELEYQKSPEFIEKEARNKLNMIKPNERVYVVDGIDVKPDSEVLGISEENSDTENKSNLELWVELILGYSKS